MAQASFYSNSVECWSVMQVAQVWSQAAKMVVRIFSGLSDGLDAQQAWLPDIEWLLKLRFRYRCKKGGGIFSNLRIVTRYFLLTLKTPRKSASENVVCLCRLLHLLANFSNLHFAYKQTVWTQIRLLLKEQSDLGPHCLQKWLLK